MLYYIDSMAKGQAVTKEELVKVLRTEMVPILRREMMPILLEFHDKVQIPMIGRIVTILPGLRTRGRNES